jgi:putative nucleotidyltransferase with HDIG domain
MKDLDSPGQFGTSGETHRLSWWVKLQSTLLGLGFVLLTSLVLIMQFASSDQVKLEIGDVAPRDIRAPGQKIFTSQVLTARERDRAEAMVRDIYDPPSARITRDQITHLQRLFDYFSSIRQDPYASQEQKISLIQTVPGLNLSKAAVSHLLGLSPRDWQTVIDQSTRVLDQAMRTEIRDNQLVEIQRALPTLISLDLTDEQAEVVIALARDLIKPNSLYDAEKTAQAKRLARDSVEPVTETIEKGEIVLRAGNIVTPQDVETLDAFELRQVRIQWPATAGTILFVFILFAALVLYVRKFAPEIIRNRRDYHLLLTLLLLFMVGVKLMVVEHAPISYLFPFATLSILVTVFFGMEVATGFAIFLALVTGFVSGGSFELAAYALVGGLIASLSLSHVDRLSVLLWSGVYITIVNVGMLFAFQLSSQNYDAASSAILIAFGMINGLLSASMALLSLLFLGNLFGKTTMLQLMDLARPTHPLLRQLVLKAPGTYHHSLLVSNMAEQAAERIGANSILARVGAYYHDIGKTLRPYFFVDNQAGGDNVHDRLDPQTSAQIVISHVRDGLQLAQKHHLPAAIQDFIAQHHGTTTAKYFFRQATEMHEGSDTVDKQRFSYPGPRPQRKEVGIVMLADSCEAAVRAERPNSPEKIAELIHSIVIDRLVSGELNDSELTMRDLDMLRASFLNSLQGVFHPRVKYPNALENDMGHKSQESKAANSTASPGVDQTPVEDHQNGESPQSATPDPPDILSEQTDQAQELSGKEKVIRFRRG